MTELYSIYQRSVGEKEDFLRRTIARILTVKRFFNVLLFLGSLPEEYEPDQVLRAAREKKGHLRPSCVPPASWARRLTGRHPVR
jgi:hypothetical protein